MKWLTIDSAPMDGRPVWVKGYNYGKRGLGEHRCWAWFDGTYWKDTSDMQGTLFYLEEWFDFSEVDNNGQH